MAKFQILRHRRKFQHCVTPPLSELSPPVSDHVGQIRWKAEQPSGAAWDLFTCNNRPNQLPSPSCCLQQKIQPKTCFCSPPPHQDSRAAPPAALSKTMKAINPNPAIAPSTHPPQASMIKWNCFALKPAHLKSFSIGSTLCDINCPETHVVTPATLQLLQSGFSRQGSRRPQPLHSNCPPQA